MARDAKTVLKGHLLWRAQEFRTWVETSINFPCSLLHVGTTEFPFIAILYHQESPGFCCPGCSRFAAPSDPLNRNHEMNLP